MGESPSHHHRVDEWGLEPVWTAHAAVFASQILEEPYVEGLVGVIQCGARAVHQVSVLGTVVELSAASKAIHFEVDDGSAVLGCVWWRTDIVDAALDVAACLEMLQLGRAVTVWGRISTYKGARQLNVHHIAVERDPHAEIAGWLRIVDLMDDIYAAPALQHEVHRQQHKVPPDPLEQLTDQCLRLLGTRFKEPFEEAEALQDDAMLQFSREAADRGDQTAAEFLSRLLRGCFSKGLIFQTRQGKLDFTVPAMGQLMVDMIVNSPEPEVHGERLVQHAWRHECFSDSQEKFIRRQLAEQALEALVAAGGVYPASAAGGAARYRAA